MGTRARGIEIDVSHVEGGEWMALQGGGNCGRQRQRIGEGEIAQGWLVEAGQGCQH